MFYVLSGLVVVIVTTLLFWRCLPRNGECHRLAKTAWAPYLSFLFVGGFAFGLAIVIAGIAEMFA